MEIVMLVFFIIGTVFSIIGLSFLAVYSKKKKKMASADIVNGEIIELEKDGFQLITAKELLIFLLLNIGMTVKNAFIVQTRSLSFIKLRSAQPLNFMFAPTAMFLTIRAYLCFGFSARFSLRSELSY